MSRWELWEVFIRSRHGLAHKHIGSVHATDAEMAITNARDVYLRRNEGVSIWVVRSRDVCTNNPDEQDSILESANSKSYRYSEFYSLPDVLKNL